MARNPNRNNSSSRRRGGTKPGKSNSTLYIIIGSILILVLIGFIIWALLPPPPSAGRVALDKYVELSQTENTLGDGASVYVDMSNGMISAYGSDQSKADLQAIINKLAAVPAIQFYGLASGVISEINRVMRKSPWQGYPKITVQRYRKNAMSLTPLSSERKALDFELKDSAAALVDRFTK